MWIAKNNRENWRDHAASLRVKSIRTMWMQPSMAREQWELIITSRRISSSAESTREQRNIFQVILTLSLFLFFHCYNVLPLPFHVVFLIEVVCVSSFLMSLRRRTETGQRTYSTSPSLDWATHNHKWIFSLLLFPSLCICTGRIRGPSVRSKEVIFL